MGWGCPPWRSYLVRERLSSVRSAILIITLRFPNLQRVCVCIRSVLLSSETHTRCRTHISASVSLINMEDIFIKVIGNRALFSLQSAQVESLFGITSPLCKRLITPDAIRHVVLVLSFFIPVITWGRGGDQERSARCRCNRAGVEELDGSGSK